MTERKEQKYESLKHALQALHNCFSVKAVDILSIAEKFHDAMHKGLAGQKWPLKMLPSFLDIPSGAEKGMFLSVDFGGTNVRVSLISLQGNGKITIIRRITAPLRDPGGRYDYTSDAATGRELFCFLAEQIADLVKPGEAFYLGHTFSFPTEMHGLNKAVLIGWTKEFKTRMAEGRDVNSLLEEALTEHGLDCVKPVAVTNDTVATLLAAAYSDSHADIGSICGTGHNTCYLEPQPAHLSGPMIINIESGNFDSLPVNIYDRQLDLHSEKPGKQVLEKMVSGRYLGELMRLVVLDLVQEGHLFEGKIDRISGFPFKANSLSTEQLPLILGDETTSLTGTAAWIKGFMGISNQSPPETAALKAIAALLSARSARLVAATYIGILQHLDPLLEVPHTIAVDGSIYDKMPGFASNLRTALDEVLEDKAGQVTIKFTKDGSGMGAAVAAAIAAASEDRDEDHYTGGKE